MLVQLHNPIVQNVSLQALNAAIVCPHQAVAIVGCLLQHAERTVSAKKKKKKKKKKTVNKYMHLPHGDVGRIQKYRSGELIAVKLPANVETMNKTSMETRSRTRY
jgi:hypothetical protein